MGNKINPEGFRMGVTKKWKAQWFASGKDRVRNILEDSKIRAFLKSRLSNAGLSRIEVERSISSVLVRVKVSRPGVVIGRGGAGTTALREELIKLTNDKVELVVEEIKDFDTSAELIAQNMARQIIKRFPYRRAMVMAMEKAMDKGAKGIKIRCAGVLSGPSSISRSDTMVRGTVPLQTLRADIDFGRVTAFTSYGNIGIKIWVYKGEVKE